MLVCSFFEIIALNLHIPPLPFSSEHAPHPGQTAEIDKGGRRCNEKDEAEEEITCGGGYIHVGIFTKFS